MLTARVCQCMTCTELQPTQARHILQSHSLHVWLKTQMPMGLNRRQKQTKTAGGNEMEAVRNYFNTEGFGRWQKIYGDKDDVSKVCHCISESSGSHCTVVGLLIGAPFLPCSAPSIIYFISSCSPLLLCWVQHDFGMRMKAPVPRYGQELLLAIHSSGANVTSQSALSLPALRVA